MYLFRRKYSGQPFALPAAVTAALHSSSHVSGSPSSLHMRASGQQAARMTSLGSLSHVAQSPSPAAAAVRYLTTVLSWHSPHLLSTWSNRVSQSSEQPVSVFHTGSAG